jgi:phosphoserine phosphatase
LVWNNGLFSGELAQGMNVGESKRDSLRPFAKEGKIFAAYGDTFSDVPMLELSENPVAVCPDERLRAEAQTRGWRVLEEG